MINKAMDKTITNVAISLCIKTKERTAKIIVMNPADMLNILNHLGISI